METAAHGSPAVRSVEALANLTPSGGLVHATCVAVARRGLLICGPSGSGKSSLALQMLGLGATLVADDRTQLAARADGPPVASAPKHLLGKIEARGLGLLAVEPAPPTQLVAVLDLSRKEAARMPDIRTVDILAAQLPLLHNADSPHFATALFLYLKGERTAP